MSVEVRSAHLPDTRVGPLTVWVSRAGVRRIEFGAFHVEQPGEPGEALSRLLARAVLELQEYLARARTSFDLPLDLAGQATELQRAVYGVLTGIGYGHLTSYGEVARALGRPNMARAVGRAVGANPIPILIPCHRVVSSDGRLTGFGGGLPAKIELLRIEGIEVDGDEPSSRVRPEVIPLDL